MTALSTFFLTQRILAEPARPLEPPVHHLETCHQPADRKTVAELRLELWRCMRLLGNRVAMDLSEREDHPEGVELRFTIPLDRLA
ncbi:MAG: hypothetical protein R3B13_16350 [Polyangiaceae bacterium]